MEIRDEHLTAGPGPFQLVEPGHPLFTASPVFHEWPKRITFGDAAPDDVTLIIDGQEITLATIRTILAARKDR